MTDSASDPPLEISTFDPVCGEMLEPDHAVASYEHEGRTFYFRHIKCKLLFERDPAGYLDEGVPKVARRVCEDPGSIAAGSTESRRGSSRYGAAATAAGASIVVLLGAGSFLLFGALDNTEADSGSDDSRPTAADPVVVPDAAALGVEPPEETAADGAGNEAEPGARGVSPQARMLLDRGRSYLKENKLGPAVADLEQCIEAAPELAEAYVVLGVAYRRQERHKAAVGAFLTYLRLSPDAADIERVRELMQATGQGATALGAPKIVFRSNAAHTDGTPAGNIITTLKLDRRRSPREQLEVGNDYLAKNEIRLAVAAFRRTIALDPKFAEAYAALAIAYRRQDRHKRAGETMVTYLSLIRNSENAEPVRRMVNEYEPAKPAQP